MSTSDGNPALLNEAVEMHSMLCSAAPKDRFAIIYALVGPNMDQLCEICEMFDVQVEGFTIDYTIEGKPYTQEVEICDEETMAAYVRLSNEDIEDVLNEILSRELSDEYYEDVEEEDEDDNDIVDRLYKAFFEEEGYVNPFEL